MSDPDLMANRSVAGVRVAVTDTPHAVDYILAAGRDRNTGTAIRLVGAKEIALASRDDRYRALMAADGINLPDGTPVAWVLKARCRAHRLHPERVRGANLFRSTLGAGRASGTRHYFLGTTPDTLRRLVDAAEAEFPGVLVVGSWSPPFAPLDEAFFDEAVSRVTAVDADVIWVGLGAPKQDYAVTGLADQVTVPCVAVGAAFDFVAGSVAEAPRWIQNSGFEWLYRLAREPRRLWRRYLIGNAQFVYALIVDLRRHQGSNEL